MLCNIRCSTALLRARWAAVTVRVVKPYISPRLDYSTQYTTTLNSPLTPSLFLLVIVMDQTVAKLEALLSKLERSGQEVNVAKVKDLHS